MKTCVGVLFLSVYASFGFIFNLTVYGSVHTNINTLMCLHLQPWVTVVGRSWGLEHPGFVSTTRNLNGNRGYTNKIELKLQWNVTSWTTDQNKCVKIPLVPSCTLGENRLSDIVFSTRWLTPTLCGLRGVNHWMLGWWTVSVWVWQWHVRLSGWQGILGISSLKNLSLWLAWACLVLTLLLSDSTNTNGTKWTSCQTSKYLHHFMSEHNKFRCTFTVEIMSAVVWCGLHHHKMQ